MIRSAIVLGLVVSLAIATRSFLPADTFVTGSGSALAFGFLLLCAVQTGHLFHGLRLPHLTGFLLCGAIFGPEIYGLLTPRMVEDLGLIKRVAVGLIALTAGCELNFRVLGPRLRGIAAYALGGQLTAGVLLVPLFFFATSRFDFAAGFTVGQRLVLALIGANVLIAYSPSVVMGILSETRAAGRLSSLALSIVVLADLVVAVSFSFTEGAVRSAFPSTAVAASSLAWHVGGSFLVGAAVGTALWLYIRYVSQRVALFIFTVFFVVAEAGNALHLDPLLVGLAAGLFLENVSPIGGHRVIEETEPAAVPTFAVFFAVIGAEIHVHAFLKVAVWGIAAALTRGLGVYFGARGAARLAGRDRDLGRSIPFGLLPQAGIAIALANLVKSRFGAWGEGLGTLLLGSIVVNELVGPILFRTALARAGEIGARTVETAHEPHGEPAPAAADPAAP